MVVLLMAQLSVIMGHRPKFRHNSTLDFFIYDDRNFSLSDSGHSKLVLNRVHRFFFRTDLLYSSKRLDERCHVCRDAPS